MSDEGICRWCGDTRRPLHGFKTCIRYQKERVEELQAENERLKTPTMYWPGDETMSQEDEYDIVDILLCDCPDYEEHKFEVMCARSLPARTMMARRTEGKGGYEWRWIEQEVESSE